MLFLHAGGATFLCPRLATPFSKIRNHGHVNPLAFVPFSMDAASQYQRYGKTRKVSRAATSGRQKMTAHDIDSGTGDEEDDYDGGGGGGGGGNEVQDEVKEEQDDKFSNGPVYTGKEDKEYDKDPELADILGTCLEDPQKARSKMEERLRKKRNKILHTKTGSEVPPKVIFNKFDFSSSYIWLEFYNAPLEKDISLICDIIRAWHIIGRLGGFNSMNMQLSQSSLDKRLNYDATRGANMSQTTFYNIGDLQVQDNLARIWVDIGTSEPLLLDVLINALTQISSDYVGIKQLMFGGTEFESWKESLTSEDVGGSVSKI